MRIKTPLDIDKAEALKAVRAAIRLKYSLLADREIAEKLPEVEAKIDKAVALGRPLELNPADYWTEASE